MHLEALYWVSNMIHSVSTAKLIRMAFSIDGCNVGAWEFNGVKSWGSSLNVGMEPIDGWTIMSTFSKTINSDLLDCPWI